MTGSAFEFRTAIHPETDVLVRSYLKELCSVIETKCGSEIVGVFLTGSLSMGEGSSVSLGDTILLLSDFDLGVVTNEERERDRLTPLLKQIEGSFCFLKEKLVLSLPLRLPIYTKKDIRSQEPKMETVDMANHAKILLGDDDCLKELPIRDASEITKGEALALIENRARESLRSLENFRLPIGPSSLVTAYLAGKAVIDCVTSFLAFRGEYVSGQKERISLFLRDYVRNKSEPGDIIPALADEASFWVSFRENPDIFLLKRRYGVMPSVVGRARELMRKLWFWELNRLPGTPSDEPSVLVLRSLRSLSIRESGRELKTAIRELISRGGDTSRFLREINLIRYGSEEELLRKLTACFFFEMPEKFWEDWECSQSFLHLAGKLFPRATLDSLRRNGGAWARFLAER